MGDGPPLLLCHASFASHVAWRTCEPLLARHFRVVSWDYRGHGRSDAPDEPARYSMAQVVDDLRAVHEAAAGGAPACVAGLSIGGLIALGYALAQPPRVRALALCNTGPGFKNPEAAAEWRDMLERAAKRLEQVGIAAYLEGRRARAELLGLDPDSAAARELGAAIQASSVAGLVRFARQVAGPVPNLVDRLADVRAPALILVGSEDPNFQRASHVLASKLPRARRIELAGAGHVLNLDQPEAFARCVVELWEAGVSDA